MNIIGKPLIIIALLTLLMAFEKADISQFQTENESREVPIYKDPSYPIEKRVDDLLQQMTLEEKIGQLNMPCVYISAMGNGIDAKIESVKKMAEGTFLEGVGPSGGFFTLGNNILLMETQKQAEFFNEVQRIALEKTRLGIPLLQTEEGTHGLMIPGATIFPEGPALGSTWDLDLLSNIYSAVAREARAVGIHQIYTLAIEPIRDPRLGRNQESYSEDPWYLSRIAETVVKAVQGDDISAKDKTVAGLAHFPGQSEPVSGMERGAMEISERKLRDVFLPPWIAGIKKSGALGVMATYPSINGIPTHASEFLLTDILRNELEYEGLVLGEGGGLTTLEYEGLAHTPKEAGVLALKAGLDVGVSWEEAYLRSLYENVREGNISMDLIDRSVKRVLRLKFRLGLFENPYADPKHAEEVRHTQEHQEIALKAAREGIVLLKNEKNLLPINKSKIHNVAVIGPNADHAINQLGDYTTRIVKQEIATVLKGIQEKVPAGVNVQYVEGCKVIGNELNEIAKAAEVAKSADLAVVVLGENGWQTPNNQGTSGEGYDVANLELTGMQEDLLKAVYETGTPTILVLINGRPLAIPWAAENIPAILDAWIPGEKGGDAVADIIFGDYNPSGKLSITIPRHSGQIPVYYNYMPSKQYWIDHHWGAAYADMPATPLWEFGFGLSYTTFEYSNLTISPNETGIYGDVNVSVEIKNTGDRKGEEVVQLYIRDVITTATRPVKELRGFKRVALQPEEKQKIEFTLKHDDLAYYNKHMEFTVEPGTFKVMVGSSSEDIRLTGEFEIKDLNSGKSESIYYYNRNH